MSTDQPTMTPTPRGQGKYEPHSGALSDQLNWLRAGVLGANDGIVSIAGLVVGVAGATSNLTTILTAGTAGVVAGALSMAGGEYVSVSTQRDTEEAALNLERWELQNLPTQELDELTKLYEDRGITPEVARQVAEQLTAHNALGAHAEVELHVDPEALTNPWLAAGSSFAAFLVGGSLPFLAIMFPVANLRVIACVVAVAIALVITGYVSARLGKAHIRPAITRNVAVGLLTMGVTYAIGALVGTAVG